PLSAAHARPCFVVIATPPSEISTLSLHDALPISREVRPGRLRARRPHPASRRALRSARGHGPCRHSPRGPARGARQRASSAAARSEEHTSELPSRENLVCRLLLEKKKQNINMTV